MMREMAERTPDGARWFRSADGDMFIWENGAGEFEACQLAYHESGTEQVFLWSRERGVAEYATVDDGETGAGFPRSPLLVAAAGIQPTFLRRFEDDSATIDNAVRAFVLALLRDALARPRDANNPA